jgi:hypothetical protein
MNILIITIGTSDVQLNGNINNGFSIRKIEEKNKTYLQLIKETLPQINLKVNRGYEGSFLLNSPRIDGELISQQFSDFETILSFPLIEPVINHLEKNRKEIKELWLVYTDQNEASIHFKNNDTLYFKDIIKKKFQPMLPDTTFVDYKISEEIKNIDRQYEDFYQKALSLTERRSEIENIFLLPQGGIDQINQALTLQLIQLFKDKVILYQNAEQNEPTELKFPHLFLKDLTKQNVIKHIKDYDFAKARELILDNVKLANLAHYASCRLRLLHDKIDDNLAPEYPLKWKCFTEIQKLRIKVQDLTYYFKILCKQNNFNEALTQLFVITDNIFALPISEYSGEMVGSFYDRTKEAPGSVNENWEKFIEEKLGKGYVVRLKKIKKNNPNFLALSCLFRMLIIDGMIQNSISVEEVKKLTLVVNELREIRNGIVHRLGATTAEDLDKVFTTYHLNMDGFFTLLDKMNDTEGMGIYQEIQKKILSAYGEAF